LLQTIGERFRMAHPQLEALIHAAVERQITVAELTSAVRTLPQEQRDIVYSTIRRKQRERAPRLTVVPKHRIVTN
jgi:hypothetical protein